MPAQSANDIFDEWCNATTAHGVIDTHSARKHWPSLLFWSTILIAFTAVEVWQISELIKAYVNGAHYGTTVTFEETDIALLPHVTICNSNRANVSKMAELNLTANALSYLNSAFYTNYPVQLYTADAKALFSREWLDFVSQPGIVEKNLSDPHELLHQLAHTCEGSVVWSAVGVGVDSYFLFCSETRRVMNVYGSCVSLPPAAKRNQTLPGPGNGLRIILDAHTELYPNVGVNNYLDEGFVILVNDEPDHPFPVNPIAVSPSTHTLISISTQKRVFVPPAMTVFPWPCSPTARLKTLKGQFNKDTCVYDCYVYYSALLCNCTFIGIGLIPDSLNFSTCQPDKMPCLQSLQNISTEFDFWDDYFACNQQCRISSCNERTEVLASTSSARFPSSAAIPSMLAYLTVVNLSETTEARIRRASLVDIYFSQIGSTTIQTQETTPVFQVIGNIGGQLGLWMGASVITVVQAFYYLLMCRRRIFSGADNDIRNLSTTADTSVTASTLELTSCNGKAFLPSITPA